VGLGKRIEDAQRVRRQHAAEHFGDEGIGLPGEQRMGRLRRAERDLAFELAQSPGLRGTLDAHRFSSCRYLTRGGRFGEGSISAGHPLGVLCGRRKLKAHAKFFLSTAHGEDEVVATIAAFYRHRSASATTCSKGTRTSARAIA
jgi:hypothetical protein